MKAITRVMFFVVVLVAPLFGENLPDAPSSILSSNAAIAVALPSTSIVRTGVEHKQVVDRKFLSLAALSTASTFADSFTTLWATDNWKHGRTGVCNVEAQSPWLYGTHPTAARAYSVAAFKSAGSIFSSYMMKKHSSRFWSVPMAINSAISLQGMSQNLAMCR